MQQEEMIGWCDQCDVEGGHFAKDTKAFKKRISAVLGRICDADD